MAILNLSSAHFHHLPFSSFYGIFPFVFYHYYDESGKGVTEPIDYSISHVMRTPDHDERVKNPYRPMSIVVDCIK